MKSAFDDDVVGLDDFLHAENLDFSSLIVKVIKIILIYITYHSN